MPVGTVARRLGSLTTLVTLVLAVVSCGSVATLGPSGSPSSVPTSSASASPSPSSSPTPAASDQDPGYVPALSAIQMVGPRLGWAVGSHAIFATVDGTHWSKQYGSTEEFVGVDFVNASTGWAVGVRSLLGTSDGGKTWRSLGEPSAPLRSVHFVDPLRGWGIAGGTDPEEMHGWLVPAGNATLVSTHDGGLTWTALDGPANPQTICFSELAQGWIGAQDGVYVYRYVEQGQSWSKTLQRSDQAADSGRTLIECAAPRALWVEFIGGGAAAGHAPYVIHATVDGQSWRTVMAESGTIGNSLPGVPAGSGSYPASFSVVDPADAVFVGDTPPAMAASCVIASNGGATLKRTGSIANAAETFAAAFTSTSSGWVLTRNASGDYVIVATSDGGYHWSQQLAVAPSSAG